MGGDHGASPPGLTNLGERGVEDDVGAVLEQRHGGAAHPSARGERGLDGARARGARHAGDPHLHPPHAGRLVALPLRRPYGAGLDVV